MRKLFVFFILTLSLSSYGEVTIRDFEFKSRSGQGQLQIPFDGVMRGAPEMKVDTNSISIFIPNSKVKKEVDKEVTFATKTTTDTIISMKNRKNDSLVEVKLPYNIKKHYNKLSLTLKDNHFELTFPRVRIKEPRKTNRKIHPTAKNNKVEEIIDDSFIASLMKEKTGNAAKSGSKLKNNDPAPLSSYLKEKDEVQTNQSSVKKETDTSLVKYIGKFVFSLGAILLLLYGILTLFKKGAFSRGKLGFLNNTNQVQVLSTTHIAPKKSLVMVKVHKQVFLIGNSDNGLNFLSEVDDVASLLKDGEQKISGDNFDINFGEEKESNTELSHLKFKEDISKSSNQVASNSKNRFKEQLKKKVKNLKPLHPQA